MRILKRAKEDKGASNSVSFIVIMLFVMALLISFIDVGVYFNVKNDMRTAAENGARNVALYGGTDGSILRSVRGNATPAETVVYQSINENYQTAGATPVVELQGVNCEAPTPNAGDMVFCDVTYKYNGLAGNFGFFQLGKGDNIVKVRGTSVSEVTIN